MTRSIAQPGRVAAGRVVIWIALMLAASIAGKNDGRGFGQALGGGFMDFANTSFRQNLMKQTQDLRKEALEEARDQRKWEREWASKQAQIETDRWVAERNQETRNRELMIEEKRRSEESAERSAQRRHEERMALGERDRTVYGQIREGVEGRYGNEWTPEQIEEETWRRYREINARPDPLSILGGVGYGEQQQAPPNPIAQAADELYGGPPTDPSTGARMAPKPPAVRSPDVAAPATLPPEYMEQPARLSAPGMPSPVWTEPKSRDRYGSMWWTGVPQVMKSFGFGQTW